MITRVKGVNPYKDNEHPTQLSLVETVQRPVQEMVHVTYKYSPTSSHKPASSCGWVVGGLWVGSDHCSCIKSTSTVKAILGGDYSCFHCTGRPSYKAIRP